MDKNEIALILEKQRDYFRSGNTLELDSRIRNLKKLRELIIRFEPELKKSMWQDFRKPPFEVMATETRFVLSEINYLIRNLKRWARPRRVKTPLIHFIARSFIKPQPYGNVLILSPWNFPFQLSITPLIGALAAGNTVVLKMSQQVPETGRVIKKMLENLPCELIYVAEGDHSVSEFLLDSSFDYIFFTGSPQVGKHVMEKAAARLTPLSLELGGKNPCVVTKDARLKYAAKRIIWGKMINAGQTCVSPDYLLVDASVKEKFLELARNTIKEFYGEDPSGSNDFARVINSKGVKRLTDLTSKGRIITGGNGVLADCYMPPTILDNVLPDDPVMEEEIFGPVLPVITYNSFSEVFDITQKHPNSLAAYIFSDNRKTVREFLNRTRSGTAAVNDTVMQIASPYLPFGGTGSSGMGRYHGRKSFETFSNMRSVLVKSNLMDIYLRYPPYTALKEKIVQFLMG